MKQAKKRRKEEDDDESEDQVVLFDKYQPRNKSDGSRPIDLQVSAFLDPSTYSGKHAAKWKNSVFTLAVASALPSLESLHSRSDLMGCPQVLVLSAGALRASHVLNAMSSQLKCPFAKLWAKHFKIPAQVEALGKKAYPIGVGTPARIRKLFELGALDARNLQLVILDVARNPKDFNLLSLPDTQADTYGLIENFILSQISSGQCKVCMVAGNEKF